MKHTYAAMQKLFIAIIGISISQQTLLYVCTCNEKLCFVQESANCATRKYHESWPATGLCFVISLCVFVLLMHTLLHNHATSNSMYFCCFNGDLFLRAAAWHIYANRGAHCKQIVVCACCW